MKEGSVSLTVTPPPNSSDPNAADRVAVYNARLTRWADHVTDAALSPAQADGLACLSCGRDWSIDPRPCVPVGFGPHGHVFACVECDAAGVTE